MAAALFWPNGRSLDNYGNCENFFVYEPSSFMPGPGAAYLVSVDSCYFDP